MIFKPTDTIVPIVSADKDGTVRHFLGTGAFIGTPPLLLTADHVISACPDSCAITSISQLNNLFHAEVVARDSKHDLALLKVNGYIPPRVLELSDDPSHHLNQMMATCEYGTTITSGNTIKFAPATRLGNITRILSAEDRFGPAGEEALEMSFPALLGASGSPVVSNDGQYKLHGVIIANVSYHLLPLQIETVLDNKNEILEETRYMLPQAVAVNVKHVRALLRTIS